jgi:hypothetical protein
MIETTTKAPRIFTISDDDEEVILPGADPGRAVFFDTGAGVIEVYIDGDGVTVCNGGVGFNVNVRPRARDEIYVTTDRAEVSA